MWLLVPLSGGAPVEQQPANERQWLCSSGAITIGRPAKKGGTTGKADILIFGESSVSNVHATLQLGTGAPTLTDSSKYGTHVRRGAPDGPEQSVAAGEPFELQAGDVLRFGTKCRYELQQAGVALVASPACASAHGAQQLAATAAALGMRLGSSCSEAAGCSHVLADEAEGLSPTTLCALLGAVPIVTPAWLDGVAARKSWPGELPPPGDHAVRRLLLPPSQPGAPQQWLDVTAWAPPQGGLLSSFTLLLEPGCHADLAAAAGLAGASSVRQLPAALTTKQAAAERQRAAAAGTAALLVQRSGTAARAAGDAGVPAVSEVQLLAAVAAGSARSLAAAVEAFGTAQQQQHKQPQPQQPEEESEEDATEEEEEAAAAPVAPDGAGAGLGQQQAQQPKQQQAQAQQQQRAARAPPPGGLEGWHAGGRASTPRKKRQAATPQQQEPAAPPQQPAAAMPAAPAEPPPSEPAATPGRTRGSKRTAAAAQPPAASPGRKRRKTAAADSGVDDVGLGPLPLLGSQRRQQQPGPGGGAEAPAAAGAQQGEVVTVAMCLPAGSAAAPLAAPPRPTAAGGVNYKAFRPKGQPAAAAAAAQRQARQAQPGGWHGQLVAFEAALKGPDTDSFLKDERHRQERLRKADELFNATIKPTRKPAAAKKK